MKRFLTFLILVATSTSIRAGLEHSQYEPLTPESQPTQEPQDLAEKYDLLAKKILNYSQSDLSDDQDLISSFSDEDREILQKILSGKAYSLKNPRRFGKFLLASGLGFLASYPIGAFGAIIGGSASYLFYTFGFLIASGIAGPLSDDWYSFETLAIITGSGAFVGALASCTLTNICATGAGLWQCFFNDNQNEIKKLKLLDQILSLEELVPTDDGHTYVQDV